MKRETRRYGIAFAVLLVLLGGLLIWNLNAGSFPMTASQVLAILFGQGGDETASRIVWDIRLPRILGAALLGGALSISGFLLQTFFANPIASPFVLIGSAFVGAMLSMGFVLLVSQKIRRMSVLVICGIMVGYICSAVTDFAVTFAEDANIVNLHNWSVGSFSGITWSNLGVIAGTVGLAVLWAFCLSKPMGAYQLGESYAQSVGVSIRRFRVELILLSSVLSACVTAFAGPISFVGIAVPHLVRTLMGTSKPILVIPGCFLGGAVFCLFCDLVARTVFAPVEMSISSVTALFGAPIVIYMMVRRQSKAM